MKAMIFAAGLGTRLKPLTDNKPKALVECNGHTLLEYAILKLRYYNISEIIINVYSFADQVKDYVKSHDFGIPIEISDESSELLDTGGGLYKARNFFGDSEPFIVCNVDIISDIDFSTLINYHNAKNALVTLAVSDRKTSRYLLFDKDNNLCAWKNSKTEETIIINKRDSYIPLAFSGIQVVSPKIFDFITGKGKFSIIDLYLRLSAEHKIVAYNHTGCFWQDIGKIEEFESIELKIKSRKFDYLV